MFTSYLLILLPKSWVRFLEVPCILTAIIIHLYPSITTALTAFSLLYILPHLVFHLAFSITNGSKKGTNDILSPSRISIVFHVCITVSLILPKLCVSTFSFCLISWLQFLSFLVHFNILCKHCFNHLTFAIWVTTKASWILMTSSISTTSFPANLLKYYTTGKHKISLAT